MSLSRVANRYALAILRIAEDFQKTEEVNKSFEHIENLIKESSEFRVFLKSPIVSIEKKKKVLYEILKDKVNDLVLKFVLLLSSKNRETLLLEIIHQFYALRDVQLGILDVLIKTAVDFSDTQKELLIQRLGSATKKKIRPRYIKDPTLKGGFTVQYQDTVWDASIKRQLEVLERNFLKGTT